ncbi:hypothetical protein Nepgr_011882 [Nepenthes gracilis]|uniref:Uncharacterized protein n=1 Tax=Nepenthes gracilis TaxID=150966 RepID=A0AAD3SFY3_NEPGR|nr:hypothetical protein Nepgr_011882 [Nepenthes gracilis]
MMNASLFLRRFSSPLPHQIWYLIFMSSRTAASSVVPCKLGNKNDFFCWMFICLLLNFLGTPVVYPVTKLGHLHH